MSGSHVHDLAPITTSPAIERWLRIAVAICAALAIAGLIWFWPSGDTSGDDPALLDADPIPARVQSVERLGCSYDDSAVCRLATLSVTDGTRAGEVFTLESQIGSGDSGRQLQAGDDVLVLADLTPDGQTLWSFYEYQRSTSMLLLVLLFATAIVVLGRWRGVGALGGLALSLLVVVGFLLPSLLDGNPAVPVALTAAACIAFVALYLAHGVNVATTVALLSTFAAMLVTGALSWVFVRAASFTGFTADEVQFLDALAVPIDPRGLLLAGIVIGSLGVLDDVTVTQVSAVWELRTAQPDLGADAIYRSGLRIGRDHISSTVNTLFLAYAGASLPLLLLFTEAGQGIGTIATREVVAVEIVRALVGSMGLVSAVPISTWLAAQVLRPHDHDHDDDDHDRHGDGTTDDRS
jgi:uncharacterized membrane protein